MTGDHRTYYIKFLKLKWECPFENAQGEPSPVKCPFWFMIWASGTAASKSQDPINSISTNLTNTKWEIIAEKILTFFFLIARAKSDKQHHSCYHFRKTYLRSRHTLSPS